MHKIVISFCNEYDGDDGGGGDDGDGGDDGGDGGGDEVTTMIRLIRWREGALRE